ncbi:hypothetical protein G9A89_000557, partial [Geosiphon pyriformis]
IHTHSQLLCKQETALCQIAHGLKKRAVTIVPSVVIKPLSFISRLSLALAYISCFRNFVTQKSRSNNLRNSKFHSMCLETDILAIQYRIVEYIFVTLFLTIDFVSKSQKLEICNSPEMSIICIDTDLPNFAFYSHYRDVSDGEFSFVFDITLSLLALHLHLNNATHRSSIQHTNFSSTPTLYSMLNHHMTQISLDFRIARVAESANSFSSSIITMICHDHYHLRFVFTLTMFILCKKSQFDRGTKATLGLTIPRSLFKSSTKDLSLPIFELVIQHRLTPVFPVAKRPPILIHDNIWESYLSPLSSMDSGLEAFSLNPTHGSFSALTFQSTEFANYVNQR